MLSDYLMRMVSSCDYYGYTIREYRCFPYIYPLFKVFETDWTRYPVFECRTFLDALDYVHLMLEIQEQKGDD